MPNRDGVWYRDGEWWVRHERTTKAFARLRLEATRALQWGLSALFSVHYWDGPTLRISSPGTQGEVHLEEGYLTCKVRFTWPLMETILKDKTLSDVGAMMIEVAGAPVGSKEVFIVHGHSDEPKSQLKKLLGAFGLQPVILSEQTHRGRTIMEELEYYANTCSFAFVLMTPDDVAGGELKSSRRARQNVILELGWFMGRLGRENVILLSQGELELPSDILGVLYLPFKENVHEVAAEISKQLRDVGLI